jgi:hypothetical protein
MEGPAGPSRTKRTRPGLLRVLEYRILRPGYDHGAYSDLWAEWDNGSPPYLRHALLPPLSSAAGKRGDIRASSPKAQETCIVYGAR